MSVQSYTKEDAGAPSAPSGNGYKYSGEVVLARGEYQWQQIESGEILLRPKPLGGSFRPLGVSDLDTQDRLQLVNALLAQYRPHAMPDALGYYAASAVVTDSGRLFLGVNNEVHIKDAFSGRGCGETSALRRAQDGLHNEGVQLQEVYLMSGMAEKEAGGKLVDKEPGHMGCMCGECRDNLRRHTKESSRFIMLPTNDGTQKLALNSAANFALDMKPGEAWDITQPKMYPLPEIMQVAKEGIAEVVRKGYLYITDMSAPALPLDTPMTRGETLSRKQIEELARAYTQVDMSVPGLAIAPSMENVNRAMLQLIKKAYSEHAARIPEGKNLKITAVLLKADDGTFYPGVSVVGEGWLPSKPPVFAGALSNAHNHIGFTDVYMMTFDNQQLLGEMSAGNVAHGLRMPEPAGLGRLIKNLHKTDNPTITVIPPNNGQLHEAELLALSHRMAVREAFGPNFANPKGALKQHSH